MDPHTVIVFVLCICICQSCDHVPPCLFHYVCQPFCLCCPVLSCCVGLSTHHWYDWVSWEWMHSGLAHLRLMANLISLHHSFWAFVLSLTVDSKYSTVIGREPVGFQATHNSFCLVIWTCSKLRAGPSCNEFELDVIWSGDDKEMKMLWYCQLLLVSYQC